MPLHSSPFSDHQYRMENIFTDWQLEYIVYLTSPMSRWFWWSCLNLSSRYLPTCKALSLSPSFSMTSITARAMAQDTGLPPNYTRHKAKLSRSEGDAHKCTECQLPTVEKKSSWSLVKASAIWGVVMTHDTGWPLPMGFPSVTMSGCTPAIITLHLLPYSDKLLHVYQTIITCVWITLTLSLKGPPVSSNTTETCLNFISNAYTTSPPHSTVHMCYMCMFTAYSTAD